MNYLLTEDEANRLYAVRGQLRMLASLLDASSVNKTIADTQCRPADMSAFIDSQSEALSDMVQAIEARREVQWNADAMSPSDWMYLIRIVSGEEDKTPGNSAGSIDRKLREAAQIDEGMRPVHAAWLDALVLSGERRRLGTADSASEITVASALAAYAGKAPLTAAQCIEIGRQLVALKSVCVHGEFLARLGALQIDHTAAKRFMELAARFSNASLTRLLAAAGSQSKLFELLALEDAQIDALSKAGTTGRLSLSDIETMNVKQLRAAIRRERSAGGYDLKASNAQSPMTTTAPDQSARPRRKREKLAAVPA